MDFQSEDIEHESRNEESQGHRLTVSGGTVHHEGVESETGMMRCFESTISGKLSASWTSFTISKQISVYGTFRESITFETLIIF